MVLRTFRKRSLWFWWWTIGILVVLASIIGGAVTQWSPAMLAEIGIVAAAYVALPPMAAAIQQLTGRGGPEVAADRSDSKAPIDVAAKDPAFIFAAVGLEGFTGRQWLADEVDEFMASNQCGYFFVVADAGMGKTAFAAWLVKTRGYLSHFSRLGTSVRDALEDLSAQVIRACRLEDQAPGGVVPGWALTPGNFQSLLGQAAARLGDKRRLVLVVDGLDEAERGPDGMPFGLPMLLPPRVYVVATYRTGNAPPHPDRSKTERIRPDDARNTTDIRAYLAAAADELAGRLAEAGQSRAAFIDLLTERCQGVWVYLRYVLEEVRDGSRALGAIADVPAGLQAYYAEQVSRWRDDAAWAAGLLPLLATLGAAGEALPAATLAELTGHLDQAAVRLWCGTILRPLLTAVGTARGEPLFEIYHASLREVLRGDIREDSEGNLLENALELRQATMTAHDRIASRYLQLFGGLDGAMASLAEDPRLGGIDGGYPLRHLARHLQQANRADDLFRVLRTERAAGDSQVAGQVVNVWYQTHEVAGDLAHYLDDLHRADAIVAETTDQAVARHERAPSLGQEIGYALMAASIASRTQNVPSALMGCAVKAGLWSPARGLDHARRLPDPGGRIQALLAIQPYLPAADQPGVLAEALTDAAGIAAPQHRIWLLAQVAASLPPEQQADVFRQVIAITRTLQSPDQASALCALAPRLPAEVLPEALGAANSMTRDHYYRALALSGLAPFLPLQEQRQAVTDALAADRQVDGDDFRGKALIALAPHLQTDLLDEALLFAAELPGSRNRAAALTALAPCLPDGNRPRVVQQAWEAALAIGYDTFRFEALITLAPLLAPGQQRDVLRQALDGATTEYDGTRADLLIAMAPCLPSDLLAEALTVASAIRHGADRVRALAGLVDSLPAGQRPGVLHQALDALKGDWLLDDKALAALVPHLPADLLAEAVDVAVALRLDFIRTRALSVLAPHLPPDLLARTLAAIAITDDLYRARTLTTLASYLRGDEQRAVQGAALDPAFAVTNVPFDRRVTLDGLLRSLHPGLLDRALALCRSLLGERERVRALVVLASGLPADRQPAVLDEALDAARRITDAGTRADLLTALAYLLPEDRRPQVTAEALGAAAGIGYGPTLAAMLAALRPLLTDDQLAQALVYAAAIEEDKGRADALTALAVSAPANLQPGLLDQALTAAVAIDDGAHRVIALAALAPHLPDGKRASALRKALDAALSASGRRHEQLALVASLLPPPLVAEVAAAVAAEKDRPDLQELAALVPYLPADQQQGVVRQAFEAVRGSYGFGYEGLAELVPDLPPDLLPEAAAIARGLPYDVDRVRVLAAVGACLPADQQAAVFREALETVSAMTGEDSLTRALQALAPRLPANLLAEALALAPKSTVDAAISVLRRASTVLSADRADDYVRLLRAALSGVGRDDCLRVIASAAGAISHIGGEVAVKACADAICDVDRWWT
jgi:hypothetical protein